LAPSEGNSGRRWPPLAVGVDRRWIVAGSGYPGREPGRARCAWGLPIREPRPLARRSHGACPSAVRSTSDPYNRGTRPRPLASRRRGAMVYEAHALTGLEWRQNAAAALGVFQSSPETRGTRALPGLLPVALRFYPCSATTLPVALRLPGRLPVCPGSGCPGAPGAAQGDRASTSASIKAPAPRLKGEHHDHER
jgi:hypothetical protein